jgi:hypothetical protein
MPRSNIKTLHVCIESNGMLQGLARLQEPSWRWFRDALCDETTLHSNVAAFQSLQISSALRTRAMQLQPRI